MGREIPFRDEGEEFLREFLDVAKQPPVPKTEITADRGGVAINGNNNFVVNNYDRLSNKEIRELNGKLNDLARLIEKVKGCSTKESRSIAYGMFKKKFRLASYRDLPASRIDDALNFLNRQLRIWEDKLVKKVPKGEARHRLILRIYQLRSWNYQLKEEDFLKLLKEEFGKTTINTLSLKELRKLAKLLEGHVK